MEVRTFSSVWEWTLTITLSISTLSKVSLSNLLTNDFLDLPKASEKKNYFYTFESVVEGAQALY